ncbi:hypothetical protein ACFVYJ_10435 [Pontibacter sp. JAM-7]|uniref:hypothetical protein n=1 Tax=Pontibacter sp. JAM-7 TaxID=3366581 RepID=UPI003AF95A62
MSEKTVQQHTPDSYDAAPNPDSDTLAREQAVLRDGRRYQVSNQRGCASGKLRYVEGNMPKGGCRFLS